jgi:hypothetical protein
MIYLICEILLFLIIYYLIKKIFFCNNVKECVVKENKVKQDPLFSMTVCIERALRKRPKGIHGGFYYPDQKYFLIKNYKHHYNKYIYLILKKYILLLPNDNYQAYLPNNYFFGLKCTPSTSTKSIEKIFLRMVKKNIEDFHLDDIKITKINTF